MSQILIGLSLHRCLTNLIYPKDICSFLSVLPALTGLWLLYSARVIVLVATLGIYQLDMDNHYTEVFLSQHSVML